MVNAHLNLAKVLARQENFDAAIPEFQEVLRLTPDDPDAHHELGVALESKGELESAIAEFNEALRLRPYFVAADVELARCNALLKRAQA
jgi:Flp pilus assembly protein TadD